MYMRIKEVTPTYQVSNPEIKMFVSDDGRVWTTFDTKKKPLQTEYGLLYPKKLTPQGDGYLTTKVRHRKEPVHRLVAKAFVPLVDGKRLVNHIDGDKHNNAATNLEWCTHVENMQHAIEHGLMNTNKTEHHQRRLCERCGKNIHAKFCITEILPDRIIRYTKHGELTWQQID